MTILQTPTQVFGEQVNAVMSRAMQNARASQPLKPYPSPGDWRDKWIYFLLVDRFNHPGKGPEHSDPCLKYQGGGFSGIKAQLGYIKGLGAGAVWLSPVLMNPIHFHDYYGGYAQQDFLRIEPRFCSDPLAALATPGLADAEFRELVDAIHAKGMHVILDIVLNHAGDLFNYEGERNEAPWRGEGPEYTIYWRDENNTAQAGWTDIGQVPDLPRNAGVWPTELQRNDYFRRRGDVSGSHDKTRGDFGRLKEFVTEYVNTDNGSYPVRDILIRTCQYLIARFDVDGFRVDTLMYVERGFARIFANAMREFALSIGKKNFFTFGEVWMDDDERMIARYVGRNTLTDTDDIVGFDAALDFPLKKRIERVCKGVDSPASLVAHMEQRKKEQANITSSHGDAGRYFVTFLENHDQPYRYAAQCRPEQVTLALTCLYTLQGIPCLYYGMEQGMNASGNDRESARECLWRTNVFSRNPQHLIYTTIQRLSSLRDKHPALRYGRQYFRKITGNGRDFDFSPFPGGMLAYSRILNDTEILVLANTSQTETLAVDIIVDRLLNPAGRMLKVLFSSLEPSPAAHYSVKTAGGCAVVGVRLRPMEAQVIG